ncbi:MAG: formate/nitrite transporter family protein [Betaproteobacteria bacterium]|nr:formate/nitrite transporter family protein [Betaproteobacteria bacterium]
MDRRLNFDAYSPLEISEKIQNVGVTKARLPTLPTLTLGVVAGGFIGLSALFFTIGLAIVVYLSHHADMNQGAVGLAYVKIAAAKTALPFWEAFFKGVLCNLLVCLGVWLAMAGRSVTDKVLAIVFPIAAFVAAGFEHSIANMYFISLGIFLKGSVGAAAPNIDASALDWGGLIGNLVPVTLGNIVGGSVMVALVYYSVYGRSART